MSHDGTRAGAERAPLLVTAPVWGLAGWHAGVEVPGWARYVEPELLTPRGVLHLPVAAKVFLLLVAIATGRSRGRDAGRLLFTGGCALYLLGAALSDRLYLYLLDHFGYANLLCGVLFTVPCTSCLLLGAGAWFVMCLARPGGTWQQAARCAGVLLLGLTLSFLLSWSRVEGRTFVLPRIFALGTLLLYGARFCFPRLTTGAHS